MANPFSRTERSLATDTFRGWMIGLAIVSVLLAGWGAWLVLGQVSVYAFADTARLEARDAAHPVEALVGGRVIAVHAEIGQRVTAGDVLFELGSELERLELELAEAEREALEKELAALHKAIEVTELAKDATQSEFAKAVDEARARKNAADAAARFAKAQADQVERLRVTGHVTELERDRTASEAEQQRSSARASRIEIGRLESARRAEDTDRLAQVEQLRREATRIEGEIDAAKLRVSRLAQEVERRRIRAPTDGEVGQLGDLRVGSVVQRDERVGAVIPFGELKVVADFLPPDAVGRVKPGQRARMRLHGFPWTQYGTAAAVVANVASESREGRIRVELTVDPDANPRIPLQHGLPGTVEVEVERVSPITLVLRAAGKMLPRTEHGRGAAPSE